MRFRAFARLVLFIVPYPANGIAIVMCVLGLFGHPFILLLGVAGMCIGLFVGVVLSRLHLTIFCTTVGAVRKASRESSCRFKPMS